MLAYFLPFLLIKRISFLLCSLLRCVWFERKVWPFAYRLLQGWLIRRPPSVGGRIVWVCSANLLQNLSINYWANFNICEFLQVSKKTIAPFIRFSSSMCYFTPFLLFCAAAGFSVWQTNMIAGRVFEPRFARTQIQACRHASQHGESNLFRWRCFFLSISAACWPQLRRRWKPSLVCGNMLLKLPCIRKPTKKS